MFHRQNVADDIIVLDYYTEQMQYQQQMDRAGNTAALSSQTRVEYNSAEHFVRINFPQELKGQALSGHITLFRPSNGSMDKVIPLQVSENLHQVIPVGGLAAGLWRLKISWEANGTEYYEEQKIML